MAVGANKRTVSTDTTVDSPKIDTKASAFRHLSPLMQWVGPVYRTAKVVTTLTEGLLIAFRKDMHAQPNQPEHTRIVRYFCRRLCESVGIEVRPLAPLPTEHALWVCNHVSWTDIPVIGSQARVFFLSKAEVASWPLIGRLAQAGGTLFIKRGSGDSSQVREQIADFLRQKLPILFFPEATTTDGIEVKRLHGRLLAAAIETGTPIQPVLLCYEGADGNIDPVIPYIGDMSLAEHLPKVLSHEKVIAHVQPLPAISPVGHSVHTLTEVLQEVMQKELKLLQAKVLVEVPHHHHSHHHSPPRQSS